MKNQNFKQIVESAMTREIKKYIMEQATSSNEKHHIMMDGEPIATFDSREKAEEELPKYKKNHPDKELIIEKGEYESYEDMIDKLDEMGEELEEIEMDENKETCNECGGEMKEGECMECGNQMMKENTKKKRTLRIKESEFVKILTNIISESIPGMDATKKSQTQTKKDSIANASAVADKIKKATSFEGNDNPEFPKPIGKGEKVARKNTEKEDELVADNRGGGLEDLNYEIEPSEMFKERAKKAITGDSKMGNSSDAGNVVPSDLGEKIIKKADRKKDKKKNEYKVSWGHAWKEPVNINESEKDSKSLLNEEINKMKKLASYNKKTQ